MAKNRKHLKRLKSEKAKVKLKIKKSDIQLPKNLNVKPFKIKKILICEQLKHRDETEVLSTRKLNIKDLLIRLQHYNSRVREEALKQLKEILLQYPAKIEHSQLSSLLNDVAALSLDKEKNIRRDSLNALNLILGFISNKQLILFHEILFSYLNCAMTHIDPCIKEDSLYFLDVLIQNCRKNDILAKNSHKILFNFLNMICRLHSNVKTKRQLTMILNSKNTSIKSRIQILERLAKVFATIVNYNKLDITKRLNIFSTTIETKKYTKYIPVYRDNTIPVCKINFDKDKNSTVDYMRGILSTGEFIKYITTLMPLLFDIWLEACPDEKFDDYTEVMISNEMSILLKNIVEIIQLIIVSIDTMDDCDIEHIKYWFKDTFHNLYMRNFLLKFPYVKIKQPLNEYKKRQDFSQTGFTEDCLEQNFILCQIHIWFTSLNQNKQLSESTKDHCRSIIKYLNDNIENCVNSSVLPHLITLLRTLFMKSSSIWYANHIDLSDTLRLVVEASFCLPRNELQSHLSLFIGDILLECNLNELQREKALLKKFVTTLPSLLLRPTIDDITIRMICRIVLRFKEWIQEELITKHDVIIKNVKKIDIIGSCDDEQSRLMIYNLFYFVDAQIYY